MSRVAIVSPGHPRLPGGVTDHTSRLAAAWRAAGHTVEVLGDPVAEPPAADALLLQYVPFLYGRRGLSGLPARLLGRARAGGARTGLFVHEPWVPPTRLPWRVLSPLQRRQLRRLLPLADVTVTAVPAWQELLGPATRLLYVGSTLGDPPPPAEPLTAPVVFSPFGAGLAWDWITAAVDRIGATPPLIVLGADRTGLATHRGIPARSAWDARGRLEPAATLALLAAAPLVLAPFIDGLTGRRTSAAAALSAGARLLTSRGPLADPVLLGGAAGSAASREQFAALAADVWSAPDPPDARRQRQDWYRAHLDPGTLDARLLGLLLEGS